MNTITLTITSAGCILQDPRPLKIIAGNGQVVQVTILSASTNTQDITLTFKESELAEILQAPPSSTVVLAPGHQLVLHIKADLGLPHRGTFVDLNPDFVDTIAFKTTPPRCGSGDLNDVIVES